MSADPTKRWRGKPTLQVQKATRKTQYEGKFKEELPRELPKHLGDRRRSNTNNPSNYRKSLATEKVQIQTTQQLQKEAWRQHSDTNSKPV